MKLTSDIETGILLKESMSSELDQNGNMKKYSQAYFSHLPLGKRIAIISEILADLRKAYYQFITHSALGNRRIYFKNETSIDVSFEERNLLHILGITRSYILSDPEARRVLGLNGSESSQEILRKLVLDVEENNNILTSYSENQRKGIDTSSIIPWGKVKLKSESFSSIAPYSDICAFVELYPSSDNHRVFENANIVQILRHDLSSDECDKAYKVNSKRIENGYRYSATVDIAKNGKDYNFIGNIPSNNGLYVSPMTHQIATGREIIPYSGGKYSNIEYYRNLFQGKKAYVSIGSESGGEITYYSDWEVEAFESELEEQFGLSLTRSRYL